MAVTSVCRHCSLQNTVFRQVRTGPRRRVHTRCAPDASPVEVARVIRSDRCGGIGLRVVGCPVLDRIEPARFVSAQRAVVGNLRSSVFCLAHWSMRGSRQASIQGDAIHGGGIPLTPAHMPGINEMPPAVVLLHPIGGGDTCAVFRGTGAMRRSAALSYARVRPVVCA